MGKRKRQTEITDEKEDVSSLSIDYFENCFFTHSLPPDPIEEQIAETIAKHGFPHALHFSHWRFQHMMPAFDKSLIISGPLTETEKAILTRNFEIIMNCPEIKPLYGTSEERDELIVGLFGYCGQSKYFNSRHKLRDIWPKLEDRMKFKFNLGRGLPYRKLMACYDWIRRTFNPWRFYSDEAYANAVEDARRLTKADPERFNYSDVSAKNQVDMRSVQTIYQSKMTATGEDPLHTLYTPNEDLIIIDALMKQAGVDSYEELLQLKQFRAKYRTISKELDTRSLKQIEGRWKKLRETIVTDQELALHAKLARKFKRDVCRMIYCLYREGDEYENQVDWHSLAVNHLSFKMCVARFQLLKTWVPPKVLAKKSHRKTVRWLYKKMLPSLTTLTEKRMQRLEAFYLNNFFYNH